MMSQLRQNLLAKGKNAYLSLSHAHNRELLLYLLLLLFLPTQLGKHFWPAYSLVSGFRVDYLSPTLYFTDCLVVLLLLHTILFNRAYWSEVTKKHLLSIVLGLTFLVLTIIPAFSVWVGIYSIVKILELGFLASFTATNIHRPGYVRYSVLVLGFGICLESLIALLQVQAKGYGGGILYYLGERAVTSLTPGAATTVLNGEIYLRAYATFSHPNVLAGFLVLMMGYVYLHHEVLRGRLSTVFLTSTFALGTLGLFATLSRLSIFLWGTGIIALVLMHYRSWMTRLVQALPRRMFIVGGGALLVILISVLSVMSPLLSSVATRFLQTSLTEESFVVRRDLTDIAINIIKQQPFLGVGLGNFIYSSAQQKQSSDPLYFATQPVHNIFLLVTAETGILGLVLFLWILFLALSHANRPARILLLMLLFLGLFDHYLLTLQQGQLLFALLLGYCFSATTLSNSSHYVKRRNRLS